ncbi:MAG: hypothetical protein ISR75_00425 [Phycisphaerales bacterium]|nr:hypothetical protein [Planctomycetota bacterium]MBL6996887.1 hypothetical protein [Phycisphaerales bacterium]
MTRGFDHLKLSKEDAEILDQLVDVGFEIDQLEYLTPEDQQRASNILKMLGLLDTYPVEDASGTLVDATLARIDRYESQRETRMQVHTPELETTKRGFRIRMPDLISVAAVILVAVSVFAFISQSVRSKSIANQCGTNMAMVGHGLFNYAQDHNGNTPTEEASQVTSLFGGITPERTDAQKLAVEGYCDHNHLNCPGHGGEGRGFSYQTQSSAMWDAMHDNRNVLIIMSDQNPILHKLLTNQQYDPLTPSPAHGQLGQNHLRDDGSIGSVPAPIFGGDLIWILDGKNRGFDIFLTH